MKVLHHYLFYQNDEVLKYIIDKNKMQASICTEADVFGRGFVSNQYVFAI